MINRSAYHLPSILLKILIPYHHLQQQLPNHHFPVRVQLNLTYIKLKEIKSQTNQLLARLTCPIGGAPIGGIMPGGIIPGGIGVMLGGRCAIGGIPIGGK